MKSFIDFGRDLYIDYSGAGMYGRPDMTMAHMHPICEVLVVLDPLPYSTVINGSIIRGKGPFVMVVAPYCMHFTYYTDEKLKGKYTAFYVGEDYMNKFGEDIVPIKSILGGTKARLYDMEGYEEQLRPVLTQIIDLLHTSKKLDGKSAKTTSVKQKLLFGVLVNLIKECGKIELSDEISQDNNYISDVITYIVHNLHENLRTPDIADRFFVSRDKLNRDFKKYAQMSIRDFITESRMNLAKSKLREGKHSIREISTMCGFENEIYFYSFFKQNTGLTPREYSKKIK